MLTIDILRSSSKVNSLDSTDLLLGRPSNSRTAGDSGGPDGAQGRHKGASLDGGLDQLAGQWRPHGSGDASGRHSGHSIEWRWACVNDGEH